MRRTLSVLTVVGVLVASGSAWAAYNIDDFDALAPGDLGTQGAWNSSGVTVTNSPTYAASALAAYMGDPSVASNTVDETPTIAWTEFRIRAALGNEPPPTDPTNGASLALYVGDDGYVRVWNDTGWQACSNSIWGDPAPAVSSADFAAIAIYQNFSTSTNVVFVNDVIVAQDIPFPDSPAGGKYNYFVVQNADSNAVLETVWIQTTNDTSRHGADSNGVFGTDADEVVTYGYAARELGVGGADGYPQFATIQAAIDACRDNDTVWIAAGTYTQDVTVAKNVTFGGQGFTLDGDITVASGYTLTLNYAVTASNLTATGTVAVDGGGLTVMDTISVPGTLAVANGVTVTGATVNVSGSGSVTLSAASELLSADLDITDSGTLDSIGGSRLVDSGLPVDMTGVFSLGSEWDTQAISTLNFSENWDLFAGDQRVDKLGFRGWGASAGTVLVKTGEGVSGTKACILPTGEVVSNRISTAATKIWTDYYIRPCLGVEPSNVATSTSAFATYVNSNGYLVVATGGAWTTLNNNIESGAVTSLEAGTMRRVTVFKDFTDREFAVFVEGDLLCEQQAFSGPAVATYKTFVADNNNSAAYLDSIDITTAIPSGSSDLDEDTLPDMYEIGNYGTIGGDPLGTLFRFM